MPYAIFVDEVDDVWLSDFGANALVRFDPETERFTCVRLPSSPANVRQILGRPGEVWGAESGVDKLVVVRTLSSGHSSPSGTTPRAMLATWAAVNGGCESSGRSWNAQKRWTM